MPGLRPRSASFSVYEEQVEEEARGRRAEMQLRKRRPSPLLPVMRDEQGSGKAALQLQLNAVEGGREEEEGESSGALAAMLSPIYEQPMDFVNAGQGQVTSP